MSYSYTQNAVKSNVVGAAATDRIRIQQPSTHLVFGPAAKDSNIILVFLVSSVKVVVVAICAKRLCSNVLYLPVKLLITEIFERLTFEFEIYFSIIIFEKYG